MDPNGPRRQGHKAAMSHFCFWMLFCTLEGLPQLPTNKNQPCSLTSSLDRVWHLLPPMRTHPRVWKMQVTSLRSTVLLKVARTNIYWMLVMLQFECILLFNPHISLHAAGHVIIPILQMRKLKSRKLGKLPKVTQKVEKSRIWAQVI